MIRSKLMSFRFTKSIYGNIFRKANEEITHRSISSGHKAFAGEKPNLTSNPDQSLTSDPWKSPEREFLVKLRNDPDSFGPHEEPEVVDEGDLQEETFFTEQPDPSQRLRTKQYADIIKSFIRQRKIKEALDVLEVRMLQEDKVKPEGYIYNLLLGALGRVGYTKKAFSLYNKMKKRGLKVTGGTYTALFNACANSPWPMTDGLTRATHLYNVMIEKGHEPNETTYNAMIKAFGRTGDISKAFAIADEMLSKNSHIADSTINFLLQACITDKESGFRHALLVWRKLVQKNIKPNLYTYNLLLRSIRDCGLGDIEVTRDVITKIVSPDTKLLTSGNDEELQNSPDLRPNLLTTTPHLGNVISLSEITKPEDKLLLVGGCKGFLENMAHHKCTPDIKTITLLLDCIPSTSAAEKELLSTMKKHRIKPDISFYNMLIKRRSMRYDYSGAKEVVEMMKKDGYRHDVITYGVLALGCETKEQCDELLQEMEENNYSINSEILGTMLRQACSHRNFKYVLHIMEYCITSNIQPNKKFMETLEIFKKSSKKTSNNKDFAEEEEKMYRKFKKRYKTWKEQVHVAETEDKHPWQQFREVNDSKTKYKSKETRFKPRHISLYRVKTSSKWKQQQKTALK